MKYYTQIGCKFVISKNNNIMRNLNLLLVATIILLVSCTKDDNLIPDTLFTGRWGGQGISVLVSDTQVTLDFNCASGTISKKVMLSNNLFLERGTYTQNSGNMPINAILPEPQIVQYEGNLSGSNLSLVIKSEDGNTIIGEYMIVKNESGKIIRCM
jgi:hypothetical protein